MAVPHAAGVAAVYLGDHPTATPKEVPRHASLPVAPPYYILALQSGTTQEAYSIECC